jgi:hypothetical protein
MSTRPFTQEATTASRVANAARDNRMAMPCPLPAKLPLGSRASTVAQVERRHFGDRRIPSEVEPGVTQASLVAILHAPKTVHTTSQAAITAAAMAVDSGTKYDESRSPAGPFTIP